jgi:hypothetical protein
MTKRKPKRSIDTVNVNGVYWKDINWPPMDVCDYCGYDAGDVMMGGHSPHCRYYYSNQESPAGQQWLRDKIQEGIENGWLRGFDE